MDPRSAAGSYGHSATPPSPASTALPGSYNERFTGTTGYAMWRLPEGGGAVPQARALVRGALAALGLPASGVDDGELMACEIATNAIRHARGPYELRIYAFPDAVVCEVLDSGGDSLETVRGALARPMRDDAPDDLDLLISSLAEGGRGLPLVGRLCSGRCGVRNASTVDSPPASGKAVWFTQQRPTSEGVLGRLTG